MKIKYLCIYTLSVFFGILIVLYFIAVTVNWGRIDIFNMMMIFLGLFWIIITIKINTIKIIYKKLPKPIKIILMVLFSIFIFSFVFVESIVIYNMRATTADNAEYVIVLGCQVDGSRPSIPLIRRVNTAISYLNANQNTNVVISGGQGRGEDISEAEAMRIILIRNGINEKRIFMEGNSKSTLENFMLSDNLYNLKNKHIVIVSTDYHMFRALSTAKKLKYQNIQTLPSRSQSSVLPVYLLREYSAVMYYKLTGKI